jgi:hypothetical protein
MLIKGVNIANAANPKAGTSATRICSPPYADEDTQFEPRIPKEFLLDKR